MTMRNAFENLATEAGQLTDRQLQEGILYALVAMLDKMPRLDGNDRIVTNTAETTSPVTISSGTVTTVTTVTTVANLGGRDAAHISFALANSGALHIYDNIRVTA